MSDRKSATHGRRPLGARLRALWQGTTSSEADPAFGQQRLTAELPGVDGRPLFKIEMFTEISPEGDGEHMHLRARVQANFASALRPMLARDPQHTALPATSSSGRAVRLADRVSSGVQQVAARALRVPLVRNVAESVMAHDVNTYIDLDASSSSWLDGSRALAHNSRHPALERLGVVPDDSTTAPPLQSWAGESDQGFAQVSVLRLDRRHFSAALRQALGNRPLQVAATVINTIERQPPKRR